MPERIVGVLATNRQNLTIRALRAARLISGSGSRVNATSISLVALGLLMTVWRTPATESPANRVSVVSGQPR